MGANEIKNVILASGSLDAAQAPGDYNGVLQGCTVTKQAPGFFSIALGDQNNRDIGKINVLALQKGTLGDIACDIRWEDSVIPGFDIDLFFLFNGALVDPPGGFSFLVQLVSDGDYQVAQTVAGDPGPDINTGVVDLWVDSTGGLDTNPGTQALPFLTLTPVANYIQNTPTPKHYIVHFATSALPYALAPAGNRLWGSLVRSINFIGEVQTQTATGVATGATTTVLTDGAAAYGVDALVGQFVRITGGARVNNRRLIIANTATTITLASSITGLAIGDPYEVITPSVQLQIPAGGTTIGGCDGEMRGTQNFGALQALRFINVLFGTTGGADSLTLLGNVELYGTAVTVDASIFNIVRAGCGTTFDTFDLDVTGIVANNGLWFGYGHNHNLQPNFSLPGGFTGFFTGINVNVLGLTRCDILGARIRPGATSTGLLVAFGAKAALGSNLPTSLVIIRPTAGTTPASVMGAVCQNHSTLILNAGVTIDTLAGANCIGIRSESRSEVAIPASAVVAGTLFGARARFGGQIVVSGDGTNVTSAGDAFQAGEDITTVAASFAAVGEGIFGVSADLVPVLDTSAIQRVV